MTTGLPLGMPGIGEVMDGAVQQAPHPARQLTATGCMVMAGIGNGAASILW